MPVDRAGLYVPGGRAAYPSTVLMTAIPAQLAGVTERVLCVPPARRRHRAREHARRRRARRGHRGVPHRWRPGHRRAWPTAPRPSARSTSSSAPATATWRWPSARWRARWASTRSPVRPRWWSSPTAACRRAFAAADLLAQAEHGPGGSAVLVTWDPDVADAVDAAVDDLLVDAPRAADITSTLTTGGRIVLVDDALAALDAVNVIAPEHLELLTADPRVARSAGAQRGRGVRAARGRRRRSATTSPASTTCCRPPAPRASPARCGSTPSASTCTSSRPPRPGSPRWPRTCAALADAEGLDAHARSVDVRAVEQRTPLTVPTGHPVTPPVSPRDDLRALEGYHSPQLDVSVRLNTNESPFAPPAEFVDRWVEELRTAPLNRYPDRARRRPA